MIQVFKKITLITEQGKGNRKAKGAVESTIKKVLQKSKQELRIPQTGGGSKERESRQI